jgi:hypothetical protein
MNYEDLAQELQDRNAILIGCNVCLNCMEEAPVAGYVFVDYKMGESDRVAIHICRSMC